MEIESYYGMDKNPFIKGKKVDELFQSNDYKQMNNRLEFLIKTRGIGVFLSNPGMGKTTSIRNTLSKLTSSRYKIVYICLTTVTVLDFYRLLNEGLGLEETPKKTQMFRQIQEELKRLTSENKTEVIIAIDEAQFLRKEVLKEFIMLMNFDYDSRDFCTLLLIGQNEFIRLLRFKVLEAFKQRINMNYTFTGFDEVEVESYIISRLKLVHCRENLFSKESYHTLYTLMNGSIRTLDQLITKSLIIGMKEEKESIGTETIRKASEELSIE